ncbi:MAG TPA: VOC family protein [Thermoanaerobaculia bacterium]|nr:VOC family protein [Thermoanaerobaculia bacterium]
MLGNQEIMAFIPTLDYDKARAFYEGVLGLKFVHNDGHAMVLDANGTTIRVAKVQKDWTPEQFTILGWKVNEIEKMAAALTERGVVFVRFGFFEQDALGIWTTPSGDKVAWFKDPDGNTLSISQHV